MASSSAEASAPATDEDLVEAILGGDESAFEALYGVIFPGSTASSTGARATAPTPKS
jgi:hypothetical protein